MDVNAWPSSTHQNVKAFGHLGSLDGTAFAWAPFFFGGAIDGLLKWPAPWPASDSWEKRNPTSWTTAVGTAMVATAKGICLRFGPRVGQ